MREARREGEEGRMHASLPTQPSLASGPWSGRYDNRCQAQRPSFTPAASCWAETHKSGPESARLYRAQMDEPNSPELLRVESWGPPACAEQWKKFHTFPLEDQLEYCDFDPRLTLSDDLKIGYFKTDRATQTDVTEVLEIRELSNTTQKLVKLINLLQRDFKYLKTYLEMQFEDRLKEESMKLYKNLQMIIQEIVALHEKNENTMRKSFYKQLCDAIASIRGAYSQFFEIDEEVSKLSTVNLNLFRKKLKDKNDLIRELEEQLASYKENELFKLESITAESNEKIANLEREISDLKKENEKLVKFIVGLEEDLQLCEKANTLLEGELLAMKQKMEKDQKMIEKLILIKNKLNLDLDQEKRTVQDMYDQQKDDIEATRRFLEEETIGDIKSSRGTLKAYYEEKPGLRRISSVRSQARSRTRTCANCILDGTCGDLPDFLGCACVRGDGTMAVSGHRSLKGLESGSNELGSRSESKDQETQGKIEKDDLIWREAIDSKQSLEFQVKKLKKIMETQRKHLKCLQTEADQESKMWQKKCLILRNSLHALKDEMFTRQSFVRQFITLSDTSFNYYKAKPLYIQPKAIPSGSDKSQQPTILPHLDISGHSQISEDFFFFSMPTTSRAQTPNAPLTIHETGKIHSLPGQNRRQQDPSGNRRLKGFIFEIYLETKREFPSNMEHVLKEKPRRCGKSWEPFDNANGEETSFLQQLLHMDAKPGVGSQGGLCRREVGLKPSKTSRALQVISEQQVAWNRCMRLGSWGAQLLAGPESPRSLPGQGQTPLEGKKGAEISGKLAAPHATTDNLGVQSPGEQTALCWLKRVTSPGVPLSLAEEASPGLPVEPGGVVPQRLLLVGPSAQPWSSTGSLTPQPGGCFPGPLLETSMRKDSRAADSSVCSPLFPGSGEPQWSPGWY
ncbi:uncharacterized protein C10orf67 homolog, mitochondrial [Petaurus breviceps papuanus]|uniref:uncharacterized protein C10orf67 homolog, mitochondrial n=1 Tax=Petaurus breviceps papuanus TaxID=3040969 RepID=UPI0036D9FF11